MTLVSILVWAYLITQILNYFLYIPAILAVIKSPSADAINVPACFWFFITGAIAALYMVKVHDDLMAGTIILLHIFLGNLTQGSIALYKQRKNKNN